MVCEGGSRGGNSWVIHEVLSKAVHTEGVVRTRQGLFGKGFGDVRVGKERRKRRKKQNKEFAEKQKENLVRNERG